MFHIFQHQGETRIFRGNVCVTMTRELEYESCPCSFIVQTWFTRVRSHLFELNVPLLVWIQSGPGWSKLGCSKRYPMYHLQPWGCSWLDSSSQDRKGFVVQKVRIPLTSKIPASSRPPYHSSLAKTKTTHRTKQTPTICAWINHQELLYRTWLFYYFLSRKSVECAFFVLCRSENRDGRCYRRNDHCPNAGFMLVSMMARVTWGLL